MLDPRLKMLAVACLPALPTALTALVCPVSKTAGATVKARPPPWVFGLIWPLLFLGLGVALWRLQRKWPVLLVSLLLALWPLASSERCGRSPRLACWALLPCVAATLLALALAAPEADAPSLAALSALLAWLLFAQVLAALEAQAAPPP